VSPYPDAPQQGPLPAVDAAPGPADLVGTPGFDAAPADPNTPPGVALGYFPYEGYGCQIQYFTSSGLVGQAVAAAKRSLPVDFVRLHTGCCLKTVTIAATRTGNKPQIPAYNNGAANDTLLNFEVGTFSPPVLADATPIFGVVARYTYLMQQYPLPGTDSYDFGAQPLDSNSPTLYRLNPIDFIQFLTSPVANVSGAPTTPITF
jgi:hypothetical protein